MDVERIVRTYITADDSSRPPIELVSGIQDGHVGLLEVVKALGEYITATDDDVRLKGVSLLTNVIKTCPPTRINRQATQVLTSFFCDKLEDDPILPSALEALAVLGSLPTYGDGDCLKVYRILVETIKMRSYVQSTRYLVFKLVDVLLAKHRSAFKTMGDDFVSSYVKLAEGEKDPRNLLLAFSIDHVILVEFDIYKHLEDLYDVIFCYFPITFKPPPDDPYGITTDDLKLGLRRCMAATSRFGPLAMPLFLEKLPPSLGATKRDVLQSLTACLPVYGSTVILGFGSELWEVLKTEIFYSPDPQIEADASETLQTMLHVLYPTMEDKPSGIAESVVKECAELLKEPEKSRAKPATRTLVAMIKASPSAGAFALSQILPQMFRQFHTESEIPHRGPILAVIADILQGLREVYSNSTTRTQEDEKSIERFKDELLSIITSGVEDPSPAIQKPALDALIHLVHIPDFVTETEVSYMIQKINSIVIGALTDELRTDAIAGLGAIAILAPNSVANSSLPMLFGKLPDIAPELDAVDERAQYRQILASLSTLCAAPGLFETLVIRVLTKITLLCEAKLTAPEAMDIDGEDGLHVQRECNVAYAHALLNSLLSTLRAKINSQHKDVPKYFDQIVPRLFSIFVPAALQDSHLALDVRLLTVAASIVEVMTQTLSQERQTQFAKILLAAYTSGRMLDLLHHSDKPGQLPDIKPLSSDASVREQNLVILFSAGIISLRPEVDLALQDQDNFFIDLINWDINIARTSRQRLATSHIISSVLNKRVLSLAALLRYVESQLWEDVIGGREKRSHALRLWIWISRGLIARGHPSGLSMLAQTFELFESGDEFAMEAASSLAILSDRSGDEVLSKANHAVVKGLARQKLFNIILPIIMQGCKVTPGGPSKSRKAYLTAFGSIIRIIPRTTIVAELSALLPLILQSLELPDARMRTNLIESLSGIMESADSSSDTAIHGYAKTLATILLRLATTTQDPSVNQRCRNAALRCLSIFPDVVRYDVLQSVKSVVIRELAKALDDPKRSVRRQAVDTRARWYRYGTAT